MKFTEEQGRIVYASLPPRSGEIYFVIAYAGAGKTTVLRGFSLQYIQSSILSIAFNASIVQDSKGKYPRNVTLSTGHGLAYRKIGFRYKEKLIDNLTATELKDYIAGLTKYKDEELMLAATAVVRVINNYCIGADEEISGKHLSEEDLEFVYEFTGIDEILDLANQVWLEMVNPASKAVGMTHNGYMKLFQLTAPMLDYDYILVDEAQDTNMVLADILNRQSATIIMVGDPHQSIYAFNGAINAFEQFEAAEEFYLTQSFRFGNRIARVANKILSLKGDFPKLRGRDDINDVIVGKEEFFSTKKGQKMVVAATSTGLMQTLLTDASDYHVYFVGGIKGYNFNRLLSAYALYANKRDKIFDREISSYKTWAEFSRVSDMTNDVSNQTLVKMVEQFKAAVVPRVMDIRNASVDSRNDADIVASTGHRSKGLESPEVFACGDFSLLSLDLAPEEDRIQVVQDTNLAYVAFTRGQEVLGLPDKWLGLF